MRQLASHATGPRGQRIELSQLKGAPLTAVAGIARPEVFFDMLREAGVVPTQQVALPDHADPAAYAELVHGARHPLVCTEKDATKLFALCRQTARASLGRPARTHARPGIFRGGRRPSGRLAPRALKPGSSRRDYHSAMDTKLLELLVCPVTKGPLIFDRDKQELLSRSARLAYPVRDGIPILLEHEARTISEEEAARPSAPAPLA